MSSTYLAAEARGNNRLLTPEIWARFLAKRAHDPSRVGFIFEDFENVAQWADGDAWAPGVQIGGFDSAPGGFWVSGLIRPVGVHALACVCGPFGPSGQPEG